jgi:homoaconitase/3-isopropylmalate dehydratase large subunit
LSGKTLAEKLIGPHTAKGKASAGDVVIVTVDYTFSHDAAGPLLIQQLNQLKKIPTGVDKDRTVFFIDHAVPRPKNCQTIKQLSEITP